MTGLAARASLLVSAALLLAIAGCGGSPGRSAVPGPGTKGSTASAAMGTSSSASSGSAGSPSAASVAMQTAPWRSGKRLRARVLDGGAGALRFLGWRDTRLGVDCAFHMAADGTLRCLPEEQSAAVYADDACTQVAVPKLGDDTPGAFRTLDANDGLCVSDPWAPDMKASVVKLGVEVSLAHVYSASVTATGSPA